MQESWWKIFGKAVVIGATMIVPGVSGGTMAMILGIYDRLIGAVGAMKRAPKASFLFLTVFCMGAGLGLYLFTTPISWMLNHYENPTLGFFIGAVVGGIPMICEKSGVKKVTLGNLLWLFGGVILVLGISFVPGNGMTFVKESPLSLMVAGVLSSVALILPGISFSHFLLILGLYEGLLESIRYVELSFLIPLGIGVIVGIFMFCKMLEVMLEKYPRQSYLLIFGFILGSVGQIFPDISTLPEAVVSLAAAVGGFFLTYRKIFWGSN